LKVSCELLSAAFKLQQTRNIALQGSEVIGACLDVKRLGQEVPRSIARDFNVTSQLAQIIS
jgi:hypothetical protein